MSKSPQITNISWGQTETEVGTFKDAKLWPGGGRGWDWNETGTSHNPGIQPADVKELIENGAEIVILSQGQNQRLKIKGETKRYLRDKGVDFKILETSKAVEKYNELAEAGQPVGALIHSTC